MTVSQEVLLTTLFQAHDLLVGDDYGRPIYGGAEPEKSLALGRLERAARSICSAPIFTGEAELAAQRLAELVDEKLDPLTITEAPVIDWYLRLIDLKEISVPLIQHYAKLAPLSEQCDIYIHLCRRASGSGRSIKPTVRREIEKGLCQVLAEPWAQNAAGDIGGLFYSKYFSPKGILVPFILDHLKQQPNSPLAKYLVGPLVYSTPLAESDLRVLWTQADPRARQQIWPSLFNRSDLPAAFRVELAEYLLRDTTPHAPHLHKLNLIAGMEHIELVLRAAESPGLQDNLELMAKLLDSHQSFRQIESFKQMPSLLSPTTVSGWIFRALQLSPSMLDAQVITALNFLQERSWPLSKKLLASLLNHSDKNIRVTAIALSGKPVTISRAQTVK